MAASKKPRAAPAPKLADLALILVRPEWQTTGPGPHVRDPDARIGTIDVEALATSSPVLFVGGVQGRVAIPPDLQATFETAVAAGVTAGGPATQAYRIIKHGMPAALDALDALASGDADATSNSLLSAIGTAVSAAVRRAILLSVAEDLQWSPTRMAPVLGLNSGSDVLRAFKDLAPDALAAARRDGRISRGGDRTKPASKKST